jgi:hypothetical protein
LRVVLSRFFICFFVNVILQQVIFAWQYAYMGNPEESSKQILGMFTVARIFKNLCFFPIESVVLTLFLKLLMPITRRAGLTYGEDGNMGFNKRVVITMVCLMIVGTITSVGYLTHRYTDTSRSADYTDTQRIEANKEMTALVLDKTDDWDQETVVCIVDSAFRPMFENETDYTVSVYTLDEEAFAAGQEDDDEYDMNTLWGYSKSGPKKDKYQSLVKVGEVKLVKNEKTGEILAFDCQALSAED